MLQTLDCNTARQDPIKLKGKCATFTDYIKDAKILSPRDIKEGNEQNDSLLVAIGFAHNFVEVWEWSGEDKVLVKRIDCREQSVLHCMSFYGTCMNDLLVGVGTCMNELLIWNPTDTSKEDERGVSISHRLLGHDGGVFCVRWFDSGDKIVSCSDDRSIRLWRLQDETWSLKWTAWGHTARVWDVRISTNCIVSCGEDTLGRVWDFNGKSIKEPLSGHAGRNVWVVAVSGKGDICATGGNDASAKLWSLDQSEDIKQVQSLRLEHSSDEKGAESTDSVEEPLTKRPKKEKKVNDGVACIINTPCSVLVAQANGLIWRFGLKQQAVGVAIKLTRLDTQPLKIVSCALRGDLLAVGEEDGTIRVFKVHGEEAEQLYHWKASQCRVLDMWWVDGVKGKLALFAASPRARVSCWLWSTSEEDMAPSLCATLVLSAQAVVSSLCLVSSSTVLCGDTRGHISTFTLSDSDTPVELEAVAINRRVHGTHIVTNILLRDNYVYSCGFDGWVRVYTVSSNQPSLTMVASLSGGPVSSISNLYFNSEVAGESMIISGFHSTDFLLYDMTNSYLMNVIECGGHRRPFSFSFEHFVSSDQNASFVYATSTDHGPEISKLIPKKLDKVNSLGTVFHGRELTECIWCDGYVVSTGQDCAIKLLRQSTVSNGPAPSLHVVQNLTPHSTCVRALTYSRHGKDSDALLISGGGKLTMKFWRLSLDPQDTNPVKNAYVSPPLLSTNYSLS